MATIPVRDFEVGVGDSLPMEARYRLGGVAVDLTTSRVDFVLGWFDTSRQLGEWTASTTTGTLTRDERGRIRTMVPESVMRAIMPRAIIRYRIVVTTALGIQSTILRGVVRVRS